MLDISCFFVHNYSNITNFEILLHHVFYNIIVPLSLQNKLNYFLFCQTFEKLFIICVKSLINLKVQLSRFELQTLHDIDTLDYSKAFTKFCLLFSIKVAC
jgi:hypothetical protein